MKNKHLVLIFLLTLLIGLSVRRAPWLNATFFKANLLKLDTASVQQLRVMLPGQPPLYLLRGDETWSAEQNERSVAVHPQISGQMLAALADMHSIRVVKTSKPDTLGFAPATVIQLQFTTAQQRDESLLIGWESIENGHPATYVQLPNHEGIYLVEEHLRKIFLKKLSDFRDPGIARFQPRNVVRISVTGPGVDSLMVQRNDSTGAWENTTLGVDIPFERVHGWLSSIVRLKNLPFADLFDESRAKEAMYAQLRLQFEGTSEPLILDIYQWKPPNLPEEMPKEPEPNYQLYPFVLHSSQNPTNFFSLPDTSTLRQLCRPF